MILGCVAALLESKTGYAVDLSLKGNEKSASMHILICAPSNAAVDEIVRRFRRGINCNGGKRRPFIVRLGTLEGVHVSVREHTLEQLIEDRISTDSEYCKLLNSDDENKTNDIKHSLDKCKERIKSLYRQLDSMVLSGKNSTDIEIELDSRLDEQRDIHSTLHYLLGNSPRARKILDGVRHRTRIKILVNIKTLVSK